ncbi:MAG: hypothetical protein ACU843_08410, partial [Gammaproteobacteria bacterium]
RCSNRSDLRFPRSFRLERESGTERLFAMPAEKMDTIVTIRAYACVRFLQAWIAGIHIDQGAKRVLGTPDF